PLPIRRNADLVVHGPELFGDQLLDLCAQEEPARKRSVANVQRALAVARRLRKSFPDASDPVRFILHVGGMSYERPSSEREKDALYETLAKSLRELDQTGIELLLENLPP